MPDAGPEHRAGPVDQVGPEAGEQRSVEPRRVMTANIATAREPVPRIVEGEPEDLPQRAGRRRPAAAAAGPSSAARSASTSALSRSRQPSPQPETRRRRSTPGPPRRDRPPTPTGTATAASTSDAGRHLDGSPAPSPVRPAGHVAAGQQPGEPLRRAQRAGLDHLRRRRARRPRRSGLHRGEPVRDDDADPVAQQPFGGPLDPASVTGSSRAVASSRITTCGSRTRIRANATSCSCPADST